MVGVTQSCEMSHMTKKSKQTNAQNMPEDILKWVGKGGCQFRPKTYLSGKIKHCNKRVNH